MNNFLIQLSIYTSNILSPEFLFIVFLFLILISILYLNIKKIKYSQIFTINCPNKIKIITIILFSIVLAVILTQIIKFIFHIPRPLNMLIDESGYSFPSGHTATAFAIYVSILYILNKYKDIKSYLYSSLLIIPVIMVALSRLILQVHRPIDIFFGLILGLFSSYLSIKIYYNIIKYVDHKSNK